MQPRRSLNRCRIVWNAIFLSDVATANGRQVEHHMTQPPTSSAPPGQYSTSRNKDRLQPTGRSGKGSGNNILFKTTPSTNPSENGYTQPTGNGNGTATRRSQSLRGQSIVTLTPITSNQPARHGAPPCSSKYPLAPAPSRHISFHAQSSTTGTPPSGSAGQDQDYSPSTQQ